MHKTETEASQLIKNNRKAIEEMRERISKYEKEELPARIVNMECERAVFNVGTIALLKKLVQSDFTARERDELSRVFKERASLLIEVDKKIVKGLEELKGEQLREYMKLSGVVLTELNPEEFVKNRVARMRKEVGEFEKLVDTFDKISQTARELDEIHSVQITLNQFKRMIEKKKFD